jgi:predicted MFS family arabinose efflux permease
MSRWPILCVLLFARTAMGLQFQSIGAVSPLLVRDLGLDFALLGFLIGVWMLPGVLVAIPGGLLGRRFGDKQAVVAGLALMAVGTWWLAAAGSYADAVAGRLVSGTGAVLLNVLLAKMVADWFQERELATAMALLVLSWPLGIGLALALLGPLAAASSWSFAMQVTAWICAAALVLVALLYRQPAPSAGTAQGLSWKLERRELALALVSGAIWTLYNVAYIVVVSFTPALLAADGFDAAKAATVVSFATWGLMLTVPTGGMLADRTGGGHALMAGGILAMALTMPLILVTPWPLAMLAIFGLLAGLPAGIIAALPARALSPRARHLGLGIFFTLYYAGMALMPGIAGWLADSSGLRAAPLFFGGALLLAALAFACLFRRLEGAG